MDPEQTFLRVHARLSGVLARLLTPKFRTALEYLCLFNAVVLLALLVVMHVNFVAQPGCAVDFSGSDAAEAQLIQVKITGSSRVLEENFQQRYVQQHPQRSSKEQPATVEHLPDVGENGWKHLLNSLGGNVRRSKTVKTSSDSDENGRPSLGEDVPYNPVGRQTGVEEALRPDIFDRSLTGPLGTALIHYLSRWSSYCASCLKRLEQSMRTFAQVWRIAGWEPFAATPKGDRRAVAWNKLDSVIVDRAERRGKMYDPMYLYSVEKGYLILTEAAKFQHGIRTVNISISAQNACFGNRWQRFLIDNFVGYDTILMNSLLTARGKGYLYNFQTKELYNLNYLQESGGVSHGLEDYIVFKFGVLIMSLFVFFTTTMSVSFTLRETQARMLKFTVQLQHHARHRLPTFHLIFIHVFESLVFVPIMIGILFFLFEFFDDQLLAFMVLTLVWLCELFTMISVRTRVSMQYFPRFFFLYFMVFHIYFFSYTYGFSYLAFSAAAAFMQHLVLFFWNRFEVPALQTYLRRRALLQQQGLHVTSSAILTSAVQVTRLNAANAPAVGRPGNTGDEGPSTTRAPPGFMAGTFEVGGTATVVPSASYGRDIQGDMQPGSVNSSGSLHTVADRIAIDDANRHFNLAVPDGSSENSQASVPEVPLTGPNTAPIIQAAPFTAFGSVFPWTLGSPSTALVSFLPIFREFRDQESGSTNSSETEREDNRWEMSGQESGLRQRHGSLMEGEGAR